MIKKVISSIEYIKFGYIVKIRIKGMVKQCHILMVGYNDKKGKILYSKVSSEQKFIFKTEELFDEIAICVWDDVISIKPIYMVNYLMKK